MRECATNIFITFLYKINEANYKYENDKKYHNNVIVINIHTNLLSVFLYQTERGTAGEPLTCIFIVWRTSSCVTRDTLRVLSLLHSHHATTAGASLFFYRFLSAI